MKKKAAVKLHKNLRKKLQKHEKDKWSYFIPTDSHLLGFKKMCDAFDGNDIAYDELGKPLDGLRERAEEIMKRYSKKNRENNYNNEDFTLENIQNYGSRSAVVTAKKSSEKLATFFFYYATELDKDCYTENEFEVVNISTLSDDSAYVITREPDTTKRDFLFNWVGGYGSGFWNCLRVKEHLMGLQGCVSEEQKVEKYNFEKNFRQEGNLNEYVEEND